MPTIVEMPPDPEPQASGCSSGCCSINYASIVVYMGAWMVSLGILLSVLAFTTLSMSPAQYLTGMKFLAVLLCAIGLPLGVSALYVRTRVLALANGDRAYLRTKDSLLDVLLTMSALLIIIGFIFMAIGFTVDTKNAMLQCFGIVGTIQFLVGALVLFFIRVWVRGSQPRSGRGNIIDIILDLRYPVVAFDTSVETSRQSSVGTQSECDTESPGSSPMDLEENVFTATISYLPAAPPSYDEAIGNHNPAEGETNIQFEAPPAYEVIGR